jgi:hypothetical protein
MITGGTMTAPVTATTAADLAALSAQQVLFALHPSGVMLPVVVDGVASANAVGGDGGKAGAHGAGARKGGPGAAKVRPSHISAA